VKGPLLTAARPAFGPHFAALFGVDCTAAALGAALSAGSTGKVPLRELALATQYGRGTPAAWSGSFVITPKHDKNHLHITIPKTTVIKTHWKDLSVTT
jgi:hypothetical protein